MIEFIQTENFKALGTFETRFTDGTNLVLGDNGKGKSTLFNAIRFALYGTAAIASGRDDIPTWGEKKVKVKVGFTGDFMAVRTLSDAKIYRADNNGQLREDDALKVAEGNSACSAWVTEHLGLDYKMFSIFNMSMQGETGALITLGATELNRIVENYSGVGVLDKIIKSLSKASNGDEAVLATLERVDVEPLQQEIKELDFGIQSKNEELETTRTEYQTAKAQLDTAKAELDAAIKHNSKVAENKEKLKNFEIKRSALESNLAVLSDSLDHTNTQLYDLNGKFDLEQISNDELYVKNFNADSNYHSQLENNIKLKDADIVKYSDKAKIESEVTAKKENLTAELEVQEGNYKALTIKLTEAKSALRHAKKHASEGVCSECNRPFDDFDPEAAELSLQSKTSELEVLEKQESEQSSRIAAIKSELRKLPNVGTGNQASADNLKEEVVSLKGELKILENKWVDFDSEAVEARIAQQKKAAAQYEQLTEKLDRDDSQRHKLDAELISLVEAIESFGGVGEAVNLTELTETQTKSANLVSELTEHGNKVKITLAELTQQLAQEKAALQTAETNNQRMTSLEESIDRHKRLVKFLRDSRADYMQGVWSLILGAASDFIDRTTNGWITAVGRNEKGDFTFTEEGITSPIVGNASGAQKEFIGVAIRIGLGMALQGDKSMLLLDEPTAGMREDNADKLASGLLAVAGQKVMITHRQSERLTAAKIVEV